MLETNEPDVQVVFKAPYDLIGQVETWRSSQRPILNRSKAIRVLLEQALKAEAAK